MFCARCGQQIPDASELCPLCGREAVLHLPPSSPSDPLAAPHASPQVQPRARVAFGGGPIGVGGWLLFFCITITILSPVAIFSQSAALIRRRGLQTSTGTLIYVARAAYGIVVGIFLWMGHPVAMFLLRIYFAILSFSILIAILFVVLAGLRGANPVAISESAAPVMQLTAYVLIWASYFLKSVRVRNTYGRNL
ncbi:MAG: DUF2569 family protein [Acidobacteriia bacterium]|nr:DUF2569 family protein [Terriglobia bacterium]